MKLKDLVKAVQDPSWPDEYTKREMANMPVKFYTGPGQKGFELLSVYLNHDEAGKPMICVDIGESGA